MVVISPHLLWLVEHDFLPFRYADRQLERLDGAGAWLANLASFASVQLGRCAPVALAVSLSVWRLRWQARRATTAGTVAGPSTRWIEHSFAQSGAQAVGTATARGTAGRDGLPSRAAWRFMLLVGMGPFALTWAMGLADVRLEGHWSTPELLALGLVIAARWPAADTARVLAAVAAVVAALQAMMAAGFAIGRGVLPHLTGTIARSTYPVHAVADAIASQWRARTDAPLVLVAGETWEAGTVALNVSPRARVMIDADLAKSPGVDANLAARCGAMVVWDTSREVDLPDQVVRLRAAGGARGTVTVRWSDAPRARPVELGWTMIPPRPHSTCTGRGTAARP